MEKRPIFPANYWRCKMGAYINEYHCNACGECELSCPTGAISQGAGDYYTINENCVTCGTCESSCSQNATTIVYPTIGFLEGFEATTTETVWGGQSIRVKIDNIGALGAPGVYVTANGQQQGTGHIIPGLSRTLTFTCFGVVPVFWSIQMIVFGAENCFLQYTIE